MEKGTRMFRKSVRGFNKEDVNSYIVSTNNEFSAREEKMNSEIADLKHKLAISAERLNEAGAEAQNARGLEERLKATEEELAIAQRKLKESEAQIDILKARLSEALEDLSNANAAIDKLAENSVLLEEDVTASTDYTSVREASTEEPDGMTYASDSEKVRLYDEMSRNVGEILLSANSNADRIIRDARVKADALANEGTERAETVRRQLSVVTGRTVAALKKNAIRNADSCIRELKLYSDGISQSTQEMSADLERKYAELNTKMEALGNELEDGIKAVMRDFDKKCNTIKSSIVAETEKQ